MTSSRSRAKYRRAVVVLLVLLGMTAVAHADRKRLVVLEFEGDKAEKFQKDLVKLLKKKHTVLSAKKWNSAAEDLSAERLNDKNIKKVAKKLKVDGVVTGRVEKRRDEYIMRLKLHSGANGKVVGGQINIKADGPKITGAARRDINAELVELIDGLDSNRRGGGDDEEEAEEEEEKPAKRGFGKRNGNGDDEEEDKKEDEEEEEKPAKRGFGKRNGDDEEEEEAPRKAAKKDKDEEEEEEARPSRRDDNEEDDPLPKPKKRPASSDEEEEEEVADRGDDDEDDEDSDSVEDSVEVGTMSTAMKYSPGERAVDATVGLSFTMRRMGFVSNQNPKPAGYKGLPVAGLVIDATFYPLAMGHKNKSVTKNLGATLLYDRVLLINSKDPETNMKLKTSQSRFAIGAVFRYPFNKTEMSPVIGARVRFGKQSFSIGGNSPLPDTSYTIIDPGVFFRYPLNKKMVFNANAAYMLVSGFGEIATMAEYGSASGNGFELELGLDYGLTKNIFARGELGFETIGIKFKGDGMKSTGTPGARDSYFGASATLGYLF